MPNIPEEKFYFSDEVFLQNSFQRFCHHVPREHIELLKTEGMETCRRLHKNGIKLKYRNAIKWQTAKLKAGAFLLFQFFFFSKKFHQQFLIT